MADPRFFDRAGPFTVGELAKLAGAEVWPESASDRSIADVGTLSEADADSISFLDNRRYISQLADSRAGAVVIAPALSDQAPKDAALLLTPQPYRAFALIMQQFYPQPKVDCGVADGAIVDASAEIHPEAAVQAGAYIGPNVRLDARCVIGPNVVVERGVTVGEETRIGGGAYLGFCDIGRYCNIHPGVQIGTRGFGFAMSPAGHVDLPQLGRVRIGDGVEIGANSAIDRGMGPDTEIGDGCKIDNLVHIGHNVRIGKGCVIVAMSGIAGSTVLEDFVVCAAQVGIAGHLRIGKGAQIAAKCGVVRDVQPGEKVGGVPAVPLNQWLRQHIFLDKLMRKKSAADTSTSEQEETD